MLEKAKQLQEELSRIRRTIHMNPELGFEEFKTGALVTQTLSELGVEYQAGVGRTGARVGGRQAGLQRGAAQRAARSGRRL